MINVGNGAPMAVKIRLQRFGSKKRPYYRIVAADARAPRDGRYPEQVGTYNPMVDPVDIRLKTELVDKWIVVSAHSHLTPSRA